MAARAALEAAERAHPLYRRVLESRGQPIPAAGAKPTASHPSVASAKPKYPGFRVTCNGNQLVTQHVETRITDGGIFYRTMDHRDFHSVLGCLSFFFRLGAFNRPF